MLSETEFERRLPVWQALADLFLDTEHQPEDYARIAAVLSRSGYSQSQLLDILAEEVTPAFGPNMFSIAGEWAGWSHESVREIMTRHFSRRFDPVGWVAQRCLIAHACREWRKVWATGSGSLETDLPGA